MQGSADALAWIAAERSRQQFDVMSSRLVDSSEWSLSEGVVRHRSGRFFELRGIEWEDTRGEMMCAPFINQPEVGILGIAVSWHEGERKILFDAKFEPGNVHGVDVAPSFQATKSNFERAHGGTPPALSEVFLDTADWHSHVRQSEQGTRFLRKWNENVIVELAQPCDITPTMRWCSVGDVQTLLHTSHTLNTDARSVIATSDWNFWLAASPSTGNSMTARLANSVREAINEPIRADLSDHVTTVLSDWTALHTFRFREVDLIDDGTSIRPDSTAGSSGIQVTHLNVSTDSRERTQWDQPLIGNPHAGEEVLFCTLDKDGVARFFFTPTSEVGLAHAQLGNSISSFDAARTQPLHTSGHVADELMRASTQLATITQSDEGGRFDRQLVTYSLRWLENADMASSVAPSGQWLSPAEIIHLAKQSGFFTNEARTAISLIVGLT